MIAAVLLLIVLLALEPIASQIPAAVLAGILITLRISVMDYKGLKATVHAACRSDHHDRCAVTGNILESSLCSEHRPSDCLADIQKKMGDISTAKSNVVRLDATDEIKEGWADELNFPARLKEEVFIKRLDGPCFLDILTSLPFSQARFQKPPHIPLLGWAVCLISIS